MHIWRVGQEPGFLGAWVAVAASQLYLELCYLEAAANPETPTSHFIFCGVELFLGLRTHFVVLNLPWIHQKILETRF